MKAPAIPRCVVLSALIALPSSAKSQAVPQRQLVEALRLDGNDEDFAGPISVLIGPKGEMILPMFTDSHVRFYDGAGKRVATFGRKGSGPAEFERMTQHGLVGDTIWLYDSSLRRLTYTSTSGKLIRTEPLSPNLNQGMTGGLSGASAGAIFSFVPAAVTKDGMLISRGSVVTGPGATPNSVATESSIIATTRSGDKTRVLGKMPPSDHAFVRYNPTPTSGMSQAVPFTFQPVTTFADDGSRYATLTVEWAGTGGTYTVSVFSTRDGTVQFKRAFPFTGVPIPSRSLDSAVNSLGVTPTGAPSSPTYARPGVTEKIREMARERLPKNYPPVAGLKFGEDGTVWVTLRRPSPTAGRPVIALDASGNPLFTVALPLRASLAAASRTALWLLVSDDDDITSLVRYTVK
jgi:hypothetical protein